MQTWETVCAGACRDSWGGKGSPAGDCAGGGFIVCGEMPRDWGIRSFDSCIMSLS